MAEILGLLSVSVLDFLEADQFLAKYCLAQPSH